MIMLVFVAYCLCFGLGLGFSFFVVGFVVGWLLMMLFACVDCV